MPLTILDEKIWFPPVHEALEDGLLAIGGDLSIERVLLAYRTGIFPWYSDDVRLWWSPNPRFVLFPEEIKISHSMKALIKKNVFSCTINNCFQTVMEHCKTINRAKETGTWINTELQEVFYELHLKGIAYSIETWKNGALIGGFYGIKLGKIFFGESMFSKVSNASKFALIQYAKTLEQEGVKLIDCQVYTDHLNSMGARFVDRAAFIEILEKYC